MCFGCNSIVAAVPVADVVCCSLFRIGYYVVICTPYLLFSGRFRPFDDAVVILAIEEVIYIFSVVFVVGRIITVPSVAFRLSHQMYADVYEDALRCDILSFAVAYMHMNCVAFLKMRGFSGSGRIPNSLFLAPCIWEGAIPTPSFIPCGNSSSVGGSICATIVYVGFDVWLACLCERRRPCWFDSRSAWMSFFSPGLVRSGRDVVLLVMVFC